MEKEVITQCRKPHGEDDHLLQPARRNRKTVRHPQQRLPLEPPPVLRHPPQHRVHDCHGDGEKLLQHCHSACLKGVQGHSARSENAHADCPLRGRCRQVGAQGQAGRACPIHRQALRADLGTTALRT